MTKSQEQRGAEFRALHEGEPFVIPNPWDVGSAKVLAGLGFEALATTSSGFAYTLGRHDGGAGLDEVIEHVATLAEATELPLSVDLENGHGPAPEDAATAITRAAEAGAVGGSIEDFDPAEGLYELERATERVAAAVEAARGARLRVHAHGAGREPHPRQPRPRRHDRPPAGLRGAGADVLYAPGCGRSRRSARSARRPRARSTCSPGRSSTMAEIAAGRRHAGEPRRQPRVRRRSRR